MAFLEGVRSHFSRTFGDTLMWMFGWVEDRPAVLRPALYGAFFIWALILFRGGLIVLPIALPFLFFYDRDLFWRFVLIFFLLAPAGGFAGGLLYGLTSPAVRRLGVAGAVLKFTLAAWGYLIVLVFVIMPFMEPNNRYSISDTSHWVFIGGFGLVLGIAFALGSRKDAA